LADEDARPTLIPVDSPPPAQSFPSSSYRQPLTSRFPTTKSGGLETRHRSITDGQRAANLQPARLNSPAPVAHTLLRGVQAPLSSGTRSGIDSSSSRAYGWAGPVSTAWTGPDSTTWPRSMIAIRSDT